MQAELKSTPGGRLILAFEMADFGVALMRENLRRRFPFESDAQRLQRLNEWLAGPPIEDLGSQSRSVAKIAGLQDLAARSVLDLVELGVDFALVGGLAVSVRTEPRFTRDVDFAVSVANDAQAEALSRSLQARGYGSSLSSSRKGPAVWRPSGSI